MWFLHGVNAGAWEPQPVDGVDTEELDAAAESR